jgi:ComF family protein
MQRLIDVLLPPLCPGCRREGDALCRDCREVVGRRLGEPAGTPLGLAGGGQRGIAQLEWCAAFTGPTRASLHALKYDGEQRLVAPLASLMADRWRKVGVGGDLLVPVPVHDQRRRERGFDQAELLSTAIGDRLGLPCVSALERAAQTHAQHRLGRGARAGNVGRAFHVPVAMIPRVTGRWIVLIDDVVTTGATLSACATALHAADALAVSALTLARER